MTAHSFKAYALRFVLPITLALGTALPSRAQEADLGAAENLVRLFFAEHSSRFNDGGTPLLNDVPAAKEFLVDGLVQQDLQGLLQFDPVYDAQDASISDLSIRRDPDMPLLQGAAQIRVTFNNLGAPISHVYTLVTVPDGSWQISDIYSETNNWSLADLLQSSGVDIRSDSGTEVTLQDTAAGGGEPTQVVDVGQTGSDDVVPGMEQGDLPGNGLSPRGSDLLFVLDGSGSMWGQVDGVAKITTAKQALKGLVSDLPPETNVGLMAYGHRREGDCSDTEILYPVSNFDTELLKPVIEAVTPRGKTPIAAALQQAASAMPASDRPANVLLISDGLETCGGDPCATAKALAEQGINTRVHVVGFDLTQEENEALQCIADNGGGNYYAANDAESFTKAVKQAVADTAEAVEPPAPAPEPEETPASTIVFEETFDGPQLAPGWQTLNATDRLTRFTGNGTLFVSALEGETLYDNSNALNRLVLDEALPDGDFDLSLTFKLHQQSGRESVMLSLFEDPNNQLVAMAWIWTKGCGSYLNLSLIRVSGETGGKPEESRFDVNLFNKQIVKRLCDKAGRAYGDLVLESLATEGAVLRLKRRGRAISAALELDLPAAEGHDGGAYVHETDPLTVLRLSGKPSVLAGQWSKAKPAESHFELDRFAIEATPE
ncbi:VWA domain-containing protein [Stappia sp. MMSF_3263]|uniref:vWA domain-containing protein n=1 Tax=Stappia sp. MMSF_3263 TaxID=3046693 RepID=UPI00273DD7A6|nr:VWA domain-containing protein [Stappia sp. MMSF_3263]